MNLRHDRISGRIGLHAVAATALAAALASPIAPAAAQTPISGATPYSDTDCDNELLGGTLYKNSEVEPWLDVNPDRRRTT